MYVWAPPYMYVHHVCTYRAQERILKLLEMELQIVGSHSELENKHSAIFPEW